MGVEPGEGKFLQKLFENTLDLLPKCVYADKEKGVEEYEKSGGDYALD